MRVPAVDASKRPARLPARSPGVADIALGADMQAFYITLRACVRARGGGEGPETRRGRSTKS